MPNAGRDNQADLREEMMDNMIVHNIMQKVSPNKPQRAIDGCSGTLEKSPSFWLELRQAWVCMMKVGDCHDPVINPDPRLQIQQERSDESKSQSEEMKHSSHDYKAEIRKYYQMSLFGSEKRTPGCKMAVAQDIIRGGFNCTIASCSYVCQ